MNFGRQATAMLAVGSFALLSTLSQQALAKEGGIGNGGGAWVCRGANGIVRWSQLVDLFEAINEFGLTMQTYSGSTADIVQQVMNRILLADHDLYENLTPILQELNGLAPNPPQVLYTTDVLQTIDDSLYRLKPSPRRCDGGSLAFEQVVNYEQSNRILLSRELFNSFSENIQAALVLHEAIYKYRRDVAGDTSSVVSRKIVGLIFSTLSTEDLKAELAKLGEKNVNEIEMNFVSIRPGTFLMARGTKKAHEVTLTQGFELQTTPVTEAQYYRLTGNSFQDNRKNCLDTFKVIHGIPMCPNNPVTDDKLPRQSFEDFIDKLNSTRNNGYVYRLATEAEWEYAARAGSTAEKPAADTLPHCSTQTGKLSVIQAKPNAFGLYYDCFAEIVSDWSDENYGIDFPFFGKPKPVVDPVGPESGNYHVVRNVPSFTSRSVFLPNYLTAIRLVRTRK